MPGTHALLSASGSARWMNCPPSARIEERYRAVFGEGTSPFAEEGTKAHALAELKLKVELGNIDPDQGINEYAYSVEREKLGEIPREMDLATDYYKDIIIEKFLTARKTCPDARLFIEQKLDFSEWVPEGFGTGDAVIISDDICEVCDLKYGKGTTRRRDATDSEPCNCTECYTTLTSSATQLSSQGSTALPKRP